MKEKTKDYIRRYCLVHREYVRGAYTYRVSPSGDIMRCKSDDVGRALIDYEGRQYDCWEVVK